MTEQAKANTPPGSLCGNVLSPRESAAWDGFMRTHAAMSRVCDARIQRELGITLKESEVLLLLVRHEHSHMRMAELADAIELTASGTTRLVERLERRGLVLRKPCPSDGRSHHALLTETGRAFVDDVQSALADTLRTYFFRHFSDDELDQMTSYWPRLVDGLRQGEFEEGQS